MTLKKFKFKNGFDMTMEDWIFYLNLEVYNLDFKSFKVHESWFISSLAHLDMVNMNFLPTQNLNLWTILIPKYHPTPIKATKSHDHYFVMLIIHHIVNPLPLINHKLLKFIQFLNLKWSLYKTTDAKLHL
jgi:hypothetical protein